MAEANHCGSCTLCCKLLDVAELEKPGGRWCPHCAIGTGCKIYDTRPRPCRDFECLWLISQRDARPLAPALRPDRSKLVLYLDEGDRDVLGVCDSGAPDAWKEPGVMALLQSLSRAGRRVMFGDGRRHFAMDRGRARPVELAPPDEKGVRAFVRFLD